MARRIVHHLRKDHCPCRRQWPTSPPQVQRTRVAMPNRLLPGRRNVDRLQIPDRQQSPEALAAVRERVEAVWAAAATLPARQRTVFLLRFVEDMDLLEIAEVTGMKEGTVKVHLFRALNSVRARLEAAK